MALNPDAFATREAAFAELMKRREETEAIQLPLN
jgi:hypothetical protein